jgi:single-strand DNA-binding protein
MNKVVIIGRLTKAPELKFTPGNGTAVCNITVAVDRKINKDGQKETDFLPVVVFGKSAENVANYMDKGRLIGVAGRIQTGSYEKDGVKHYSTNIVAEEVQFLDKGNGQTQQQSTPEEMTEVIDGEDIPF